MRKSKLTPEQDRCLALDRSLRITAGAGSGKTRVLVERYLKMLFETDIEVENALALTFTKKAAAEMLERALVEMNRRRIDSPPSGLEQERWERLFEELSQARIATIHSFCESILREFPLEAGIDPDFQVMEEVDAGILLTESLDRTLHEIARDGNCAEYPALDRLLAIYTRRELNEILRLLIAKRHHRQVREQLLAAAGAAAFHSARAGELDRIKLEATQPMIEKLWNARQVLQGYRPNNESDRAYAVVRGTLDCIERAYDSIRRGDMKGTAAAINELRAHALTGDGKPRKLQGQKGNWESGELDRLKADWNEFAESLQLPKISEHDDLSSEVLFLLGRVYSRTLSDFERAKGGGRLLDFEDIIEYADRLLNNADDELRDRLDKRFRFVMVDEFQDTDPKQWKIIRSLAREGDDAAMGKYCVLGDAKQSIYGFREADVRVIGSPEVTGTCRGGERLSINFRSLPALVDFQNYFFPKLMTPSENEFEVDYGTPMRSGRDSGAPDGSPQGHLAILVIEPDSDDFSTPDENENEDSSPTKAGKIQAEADMIALSIAKSTTPGEAPRVFVERDFDGNEINDFVPTQPGHIGILLRRRTNLQVYEEALRKRNIPFIVYGGIGFFQRQEILDIYNLLSFLANPRDDIALTGVLRSPFFQISDETVYEICRSRSGSIWERLMDFRPADHTGEHDRRAVSRSASLLNRWLNIAGRASAVELIRTFIDDTGFTGSLGAGVEGDQARANIEKLLDIIRSFERSSATWGSDLHGLVARLEELCRSHDKEGLAQLELEKSNAVKIMTIHAAKGLEFPVVFIPDMNREFTHSFSRGSENLILSDAEVGVGLSVPLKEGKAEDTLFSLIKKRRKEADIAEEKRLLYVAATRARDALFFVGHQPEKPNASPKSWWDWLMKYMEIEDFNQLASGRINFTAPPVDEKFPARERMIHVVGSSIYSSADENLAKHLESLPRPEEAKKPAPPSPVALADRIRADMKFVHEERLYQDFAATALMEFDRCPAAFYLNHIAGIGANMLEERSTGDGSGGGASPEKARTLGLLAHTAIELHVQALQSTGGAIDRATRDQINERIRMESAAPAVTLNEPGLADEAIGHAERFLESETFGRIAGASVRRAELPFLLRPRSADKPSRAALRGKIDLLYRLSPDDPELRIVDYKTVRMDIKGRSPQSVLEEYRAQLECYAVAAARLYRDGVERVVASLYLTETGEEISIELDADELARVEGGIAAKLDEILDLAKSGIVPKKFDGCRVCSYSRNRLCIPGRRLPIDALLRSTARPVAQVDAGGIF